MFGWFSFTLLGVDDGVVTVSVLIRRIKTTHACECNTRCVEVLQEIIEPCVFNFVMLYATVFKFQIE